jgi:SsrA-binding protein
VSKVEEKNVTTNKKAFHDYFILDKIVAGIELKGTEVKSIRAGQINLKDSYAKIINQRYSC